MSRKIRIIILIVLIVLLGITIYKWWYSDNGYKYIKQMSYDENVRKKYNKNEDDGVDFKSLIAKNDEIVAWINIKNTPVNYPIVVHNDNTYYLNHNIDKEYSISGSLFMDSRYYTKDTLNKNPFNYKNNRVLLIYGHNMGTWTNVMFTSLKSYLNSDYYKKHSKVFIYTPKQAENGKIGSQMNEYEILSVQVVSGNDNIYRLTSFKNSEMEKDWFNEQLINSKYSCGNYEFIENSNYLILSTCANDGVESDRIILICREK
jgi:sortase B